MLADPRGEHVAAHHEHADDEEEAGHFEASVPDQLEDMELRAPDRKHHYISPVLYPHTAHRFSDLYLREHSMSEAAAAMHGTAQVEHHREQVNVVC